MNNLLGIHHVTAICSDAQTNLDFYTGVLGLRLIKLTVNFDDPTAYHLYYGDSVGTPGTILTFFPYGGAPGVVGDGSFVRFSLAVPEGSLGFWRDRLGARDVPGGIRSQDPDGIEFEMIEAAGPTAAQPHVTSEISHEIAIRGIDRVTLASRRTDTMIFLTSYLQFSEVGTNEDGDTLTVQAGQSSTLIDVMAANAASRGGPGTIHHVAWRVPDDLTQLEWQKSLADDGVGVTHVRDRDYFHSIYFREPGGALFEIATDGPGFAIDEPLDRLGAELRIPKIHEALTEQIKAALPPLRLPGQPA